MSEQTDIVNHEEAKQLAAMKSGSSNLARCYLDHAAEITRLRERLAIAERALEEIQYEDTKIYTRRPCGKIAQDALDQMKGGE